MLVNPSDRINSRAYRQAAGEWMHGQKGPDWAHNARGSSWRKGDRWSGEPEQRTAPNASHMMLWVPTMCIWCSDHVQVWFSRSADEHLWSLDRSCSSIDTRDKKYCFCKKRKRKKKSLINFSLCRCLCARREIFSLVCRWSCYLQLFTWEQRGKIISVITVLTQ